MIYKGKSTHGGDIYTNKVELDFSVNINPYGLPKEIKQEIKNNLDNLSNYPDPYCRELINKLSIKEHVNNDDLIIGNGASDLIYSYSFVNKNKTALIISPTFSEYEDSLRINNVKISYYYLKEEDGFKLTIDILDYLNNNHYDLLYICNPNNPTGLLIDKELLIKILDLTKKFNTKVFLDECFSDLVDSDKQYSMNKMINNYPNLFILKAFTKNYAMAGIRLGYGISSNHDLLQQISESKELWNISTIAQIAGIKALDCDDYLKKTLDTIKKEKEYLIKELSKLNQIIYPSVTNYLFFKSNKELKEPLLKKGILIRSCSNYNGLNNNNYYYRIGIKLHKDNERLIKELKEILNG